MLVVETVVRIRREFAAGKAIKAISRDLRLSRKVVRKAIRAEEGAFSYSSHVPAHLHVSVLKPVRPSYPALCATLNRNRGEAWPIAVDHQLHALTTGVIVTRMAWRRA
jgi:hypothetical protein